MAEFALEDFVNQQEAQSYLCTRCSSVLHKPKQGLCGHRFCGKCAEQPFRCPAQDKGGQCGEKLRKRDFRPDKGAERDIAKLLVHCKNRSRGCREVFRFQDSTKHAKQCNNRPKTPSLASGTGLKDLYTKISNKKQRAEHSLEQYCFC